MRSRRPGDFVRMQIKRALNCGIHLLLIQRMKWVRTHWTEHLETLKNQSQQIARQNCKLKCRLESCTDRCNHVFLSWLIRYETKCRFEQSWWIGSSGSPLYTYHMHITCWFNINACTWNTYTCIFILIMLKVYTLLGLCFCSEKLHNLKCS